MSAMIEELETKIVPRNWNARIHQRFPRELGYGGQRSEVEEQEIVQALCNEVGKRKIALTVLIS